MQGYDVIIIGGGHNGLTCAAYLGRAGYKVKVVERIHLDPQDRDVLILESMFSDPKALAKPWHTVSRFKRQRGLDQIEFVCAQNDRNPIDDKGEVQFLGVH